MSVDFKRSPKLGNGPASSRSRPMRRFGRERSHSQPMPKQFEPNTFAWTDPLDDLEPIVIERPVVIDRPVVVEKIVEKRVVMPASKDKIVIIGRGPTMGERVARLAPNPAPVLVGACALLIALVGVTLMSPTGDLATADMNSPLGVASSGDGRSLAGISGTASAPLSSTGSGVSSSRDPFAARNFKPPSKRKMTAKERTKHRKSAKAGAPAASTASLFSASFVTYSSYTPWVSSRKRSGGWLELGGVPTVKVISVKEDLVELYVVTDVEVLVDKSRGISYSYPLRTIRMRPNAVVRFADYRNIQGEDVVYTIRLRGAIPISVAQAQG